MNHLKILWQPVNEGCRILEVFGNHSEVRIPDIINGLPVTEIGPYCFAETKREISGEYFTDSEEAFDIIRQVESPRVRLLYDIFHFQCMEGNIIQTVTENIGKIGHFHAASVPGRNEITRGELNYPAVIHAIQESGYQGCFGLEYLPTAGKEESVLACKALFEKSL